MMNLLVEPIKLVFEQQRDGQTETLLEADLVDLYCGFYESLVGKRFYHEAAKPFQAWIQKQLNVSVTASQAEAIARTVDVEYGKFKKKFDCGPTLPPSSPLILSDSTQD